MGSRAAASAPGPVAIERRRVAERIRSLACAIAHDHPRGLVLVTDASRPTRFALELEAALPARLAIACPLELDSWPGRRLTLRHEPPTPLRGRAALIVEDAVDTGLRLHVLVELTRTLGASEPAACALLDRPGSRLVGGLPLRYRGFAVGDPLHVGYGLELDGRYGNLPDLHAIAAAA